jgi:hypothetical protein
MDDLLEYIDIFDPNYFHEPISIIGCGGMGSRIAEGLVRMGAGSFRSNRVYLFDDDVFEPKNLANQWVDQAGIGVRKVDAVAKAMRRVHPSINLNMSAKKVDVKASKNLPEGVVFICVDSMDARRCIVEGLTCNPRVTCVIETRMDAGVGVSHCFDPQNQRHMDCWRLHWYSDKESVNLQGCNGSQSVISAIFGTTTLALKQFENYVRDEFASVHNRVYHDFEECILRSERWDA